MILISIIPQFPYLELLSCLFQLCHGFIFGSDAAKKKKKEHAKLILKILAPGLHLSIVFEKVFNTLEPSFPRLGKQDNFCPSTYVVGHYAKLTMYLICIRKETNKLLRSKCQITVLFLIINVYDSLLRGHNV